MSETIETSVFTSQGDVYRPSLYADNQLVSEFSDDRFTDEILMRKAEEYRDFLGRDDLMPRARREAERVQAHLFFEVCYRNGLYEEKSYA